MYNYPYGDNQQINLNWIISEIIALHQRLDPDYTAPTFTQIYPFSDTQQLNLDWILTELKALKDLAPTPPPTEEIDEIGQALIAGAYDADTSYQKNDYIVQDGKVYRANAATTGTFDPTKWNEVMLGNDLAIITRWADATNTFLNNLAARNVANDSSVTGATVKDALDTLKTATDAAVTNVKYNAGYLKKTIGGTDSNIIQIEDSPTNDSSKLPSSKAVYNANAAISDEVTARGNADANIELAIAIVANNNTHPAITSGQYVYIKGHGTLAEGLYRATEAIPLNGTLSSTNVAAVSNGGLNQLLEENFAVTSPYITWANDSFCNCKKIGNIVMISGGIMPTADAPDSGWTNVALIPTGYRPAGNVLAIGFGYGGQGITNTYAVRVQSWGGIQVMQLHNNAETCYFDFFYFI